MLAWHIFTWRKKTGWNFPFSLAIYIAPQVIHCLDWYFVHAFDRQIAIERSLAKFLHLRCCLHQAVHMFRQQISAKALAVSQPVLCSFSCSQYQSSYINHNQLSHFGIVQAQTRQCPVSKSKLVFQLLRWFWIVGSDLTESYILF